MFHIAHLFPQLKFLHSAQAFFSSQGICNDWFLPDNTLSSTDDSSSEFPLSTFQRSRTKYDLIIVHSLLQPLIEVANSLGKNTPYWVQLWGGDMDEFHNPRINYDELGLSHEFRNSPVSGMGRPFIRPYAYLHWRYKPNTIRKTKAEILRRATAVSMLLDYDEYDALDIKPSMKHIQFKINYGTDRFTDIKINSAPTDQYLIGNCALPSCQHQFVIDTLTNAGQNDITLPLSYPENTYKNKVESYAQLKSASARIISNFQPLNEYYSILNSCGTHIHYSYRQQALGNIFYALLSQTKVILNPNGPLFPYLARRGIKCYTLEELSTTPHESVLTTNALRTTKLLDEEWSPSTTDLMNTISKLATNS